MKVRLSERISNLCNIVFLGLLALIMLYPIWNVLMTSLVTQQEYYARALILWPKDITFTSYRFIFSTQQFLNAFKVTAFITIVGTFYNMFLTVTLAFGLSRPNLPGKKIFMTIIIITMYFGGGLIAEFLLITRTLHLQGSILAMIIPSGVSAFYVIVLRTFFNGIPRELEESAKIDGAKDITIMTRIILPLSLPPIAAIALFYGVGRWNEWWNCLLYINNEKLYTLQIILRRFVVSSVETAGTEMEMALKGQTGIGRESIFVEGIKMATVIVATVPIIFVYPFLQKYFAKGVMIGSLKG